MRALLSYLIYDFSKSVSTNNITLGIYWASLVAQMVKNLPAMWETWVQSLIFEDPLEEGKATHSNILAWEIPWAEGPDGVQSMGSQKSQT